MFRYLFPAFLLGMLTCCNRENIKMVRSGDVELYYSEAVTEDQARAAVRIIHELPVISAELVLYRLDRKDEVFNLWIASSRLAEHSQFYSFEAMGEFISVRALDGQALIIILCDEDFREHRRIIVNGVKKSSEEKVISPSPMMRWAI